MAWHERWNFDEKYQWQYSCDTSGISIASYTSKADEEASPFEVPPKSCKCPSYRCYDKRKLWLQMPLPEDGDDDFGPVIDVHVFREPTRAFETAPVEHIQLHVVHEPTVVERDFYITPSAAAAGFGEDDVHDLVDGVNEMLRSEHDHDPCDEYLGAPRDYDSNHDGDLDSSRGRYDRYVPVEFQVGDITIWNEHTFPEEYESIYTGVEAFCFEKFDDIEIQEDDIVYHHEYDADTWWWFYDGVELGRSVVVTDRIMTISKMEPDLLDLKMNVNPADGVAHFDMFENYKPPVAIRAEAGARTLLHEWGHSVGLGHVSPGAEVFLEEKYCQDAITEALKEVYEMNHMRPGPEEDYEHATWISEESMLLWPLEYPPEDYPPEDEPVLQDQHSRWINMPHDF